MNNLREVFPISQASDLKSIEVNSLTWRYFDDGDPYAPFVVLNNFGFGAGSGEGNRRLSKALTGEIENSRGMTDLHRKLPKAGSMIKRRVEGFSGKYRIITPQVPEVGFDIDELSNGLGNLINELGIEKYVVFGSSMGGVASIKLAAKRPREVLAVILQGAMTRRADMDPLAYWAARITSLPPIEDAIDKTPLLAELLRQVLIFQTKNDFDFRLADSRGKKQILRDLNTADSHSTLKLVSAIGQDLSRDIDMVKAPVLIMDGEAARLVPIGKSRQIASRFHKEYPTFQEKIENRKVLFYKIGGITGLHGHTVLNTFPELMAVMLDKAVDYFEIK